VLVYVADGVWEERNMYKCQESFLDSGEVLCHS